MAKEDKGKKENPIGKSLPPQLKEKALHRIMCGEAATAVAKSMGVHPSTVLRWQKAEGVERGSALSPEANPMVVPQPDHVMDAFTSEVRKQNVEAALSMFLEMQNGVEDKYRVLMAQQLYGIFHTVMQNPPPIKNWGDVERAHKIMTQILNPDSGKGSSGAAKLQIQFDVVGAKPTVIDAEEIEVATRQPDAEKVTSNSGD
tara:strand:- start:12014 stop:12616 length:603 start_codon:yes stop_codon:yes gene_type:complete